MNEYKPRIADRLLAEKLSYMGAVLVRGAKWCGKTTTCKQVARSSVFLADARKGEANRLLAQQRPDLLLSGAYPRLIDEWQEVPALWDAVRATVDEIGQRGIFLLTGSAVPPQTDEEDVRREVRHTGTGRIARLTMRPMTIWESGDAAGAVSFADLFEGNDVVGVVNELRLEDVVELICRGGWPGTLALTGRASRGPAKEYFEAICETDISRVDDTLRDPLRVRAVMRSLARLQGTQSSASVICGDVKANDVTTLTEDTVYSYLNALKKIFVTEDLEAWCPSLRCKTPIRTTDTRYFTDPSIATAALGIGPNELLADLPTCGLFFETLAIRDLRTYAEELGGRLYHYHDKNGLECDAVMRLENGKFGLIEVKTGGKTLLAKGTKTLKDLAAKLDTTKMPKPSFLMILTADGDFAYRNDEGVLICPIGCLRGTANGCATGNRKRPTSPAFTPKAASSASSLKSPLSAF